MKKKGTILVENIIFIILNLLFLSVLVLFLIKQGSGAIVFEQAYSKQIAMLVDSAKPIMLIKIDMEKGKNLAGNNGINFNDVVKIDGNIVTVKLSEKGGYSYAFFNDVDVSSYADRDEKGKYTGMYVLTINKKEIKNE
jgi:hypothetical protein